MWWRYFFNILLLYGFKATSLLNWCVGCQSHEAPERKTIYRWNADFCVVHKIIRKTRQNKNNCENQDEAGPTLPHPPLFFLLYNYNLKFFKIISVQIK